MLKALANAGATMTMLFAATVSYGQDAQKSIVYFPQDDDRGSNEIRSDQAVLAAIAICAKYHRSFERSATSMALTPIGESGQTKSPPG